MFSGETDANCGESYPEVLCVPKINFAAHFFNIQYEGFMLKLKLGTY